MSEDIDKLRGEIDQLDAELLALLQTRAWLAQRIGTLKGARLLTARSGSPQSCAASPRRPASRWLQRRRRACFARSFPRAAGWRRTWGGASRSPRMLSRSMAFALNSNW